MQTTVTMFTQISVDGRIRGFDHPEIYYQVAGGIQTDAVLFGSNTVLTAFEDYAPESEADFVKPTVNPDDPRPIGVIPDSRGILRNLHCCRNMGYLKDVVLLVSTATPKEYLEYLEERNYPFVVAGNDHVDYQSAFQILHEQYGCRSIRTDSGGTLTSVLLQQGLIDDILLVVSPCLVGGSEPYLFESLHLPERIDLRLQDVETIDEGYLRLRYRVERPH